MKQTFKPLCSDEQFDVIIARGLPKSRRGTVVGIFPGGALRVMTIGADRKPRFQKLLPNSVVRK